MAVSRGFPTDRHGSTPRCNQRWAVHQAGWYSCSWVSWLLVEIDLLGAAATTTPTAASTPKVRVGTLVVRSIESRWAAWRDARKCSCSRGRRPVASSKCSK